MRIAFISYEYAGTARSGGIGTYVRNVAPMLATRGHDVEVFTASDSAEYSTSVVKHVKIHEIPVKRNEFPSVVAGCFGRSHESKPFDIIEGPDFLAEARAVNSSYPDVPLVVKLHAPSFTIVEANHAYVEKTARLRYLLGAVRRARIPDNPWCYDPFADIEREHALDANLIVANSRATMERVARTWAIPKENMMVVPYAFSAPMHLLSIPPVGAGKEILFLGKIEVRKGVLTLAKAIPAILREVPDARFRFVGNILPHPGDRRPMDEHIKAIVGSHDRAIEFTGPVAYSEIPNVIASATVCVFPSDWEASGFVCMEAMAAARGVIGSSSGGMAEIIDHGRNGFLVPPRDSKAIVDSVLAFLREPKRRIEMGTAAREHILDKYSAERIMPLHEESYTRAILLKKTLRAGSDDR